MLSLSLIAIASNPHKAFRVGVGQLWYKGVKI